MLKIFLLERKKVGQDLYIKRIEELLREIRSLEKDLHEATADQEKDQIIRSLKLKKKRFETLIPFSFRQELRSMCKKVGVRGEFQVDL
ncbi:MAG: hypothetical protein NWR72_09095 [Bacteroidia bacterium]|nr:hypothetical protein [Bacteroidia bacterium]